MITSFRAIVLTKEMVQTLLAQGKEKGEAGRRAGWAELLTGKKLARGTKRQLFERQHCRTALGWQSESPSIAKTVTAAAWTVEAKKSLPLRSIYANISIDDSHEIPTHQ